MKTPHETHLENALMGLQRTLAPLPKESHYKLAMMSREERRGKIREINRYIRKRRRKEFRCQ
jgi:hypothetical protein